MDPVRPWMDAGEVWRLAERLLAPTGGDPLPSPEAPFGNDFEGFTGVAGAVPAVPTVVPPVVPAVAGVEAPPVRVLESAPVVAGLGEVRRGPFLQRLQRFRDWLHEQFGASGVFLLDRDGRVIFDDGVNPKLQALARSLALASRAAAGAGNVHFKIGAEATLEVIPAETHYGGMVLGMVVGQAISPRGVAMIIDGLSRATMPPEA